MKELLTIFVTTLLALLVWAGVQIGKIYFSTQISQELLVKATPVAGTVDVEFLKNLAETKSNESIE